MSKNPRPSRLATAGLLAAAAACLGGCASVQGVVARIPQPWRQPAPPPPPPVGELAVELPSGPQVPVVLQFREGDTLVVDLQGAAAAGDVTLRPGESGRWPVRLALRAQPGRFEVIEVRGAQRVRLPVSAGAGPAVTIPLSPGVYPAGTEALRLVWGAAVADLG